MPDLSIISWNCMNLGKNLTLDKPELKDPERCKYIAQTVDKLKPDVLLIQEAGIDGNDKAQAIINNITESGYKALVSTDIVSVSVSYIYQDNGGGKKRKTRKKQTTRKEKYIAIYNSNTLDVRKTLFPGLDLINVDLDHLRSFRKGSYYRKDWTLWCTHKTKNKRFHLKVIHAPSPSNPLEIRKQVIKNFSNIPDSEPTILLGDLNFTADDDEQTELTAAFNSNGCIHLGKEPPIKTSLVTPFNQLAQNNPLSQPYDQFWIKDSSSIFSQSTAQVSVPAYPVPMDESQLIDRILVELDAIKKRAYTAGWPSTDNTKLYESVTDLFVKVNQKIQSPLFNNLPSKDDIKNVMTGFKTTLDSKIINSANNEPDSNSGHTLTLVSKGLKALYNYLDRKFTHGTQMNEVLYRLAFSDHLPLQLDIDFN